MTERHVEIDHFAAQARAFIGWCDSSHEGKSVQVFHFEALEQLSRLYAGGLGLPGVDRAMALGCSRDDHTYQR